MTDRVDPITLAVIRGALETTQREMTLTLEKPDVPVCLIWPMITVMHCLTITQK